MVNIFPEYITKEEANNILAIQDSLQLELDSCVEKMQKLKVPEQLDEYLTLYERFDEITEEMSKAYKAFNKHLKTKAFQSFNGSTENMVEAIKKAIPRYVEVFSHVLEKERTPERREFFEKRKKALELEIAEKEEFLGQFHDKERLKKNIQATKEKLKKQIEELQKIEKLKSASFRAKEIRGFINDNFYLYFDFLSKEAPEEYAELQSFIDDAIKNNGKIKPPSKSKTEDLNVDFKFYDMLPNSPASDLMKRISISLANNRDIKTNKNVKVTTMETLNGKYMLSYNKGKEQYEISINNVQALKRNQSVKLRKTLNFLLIKANEQHYPNKISFSLDEYMKKTGSTSKDAAYRSLKHELDILAGFKISGTIKKGKKEIRNAWEYIFTGGDVSYNQCSVKCSPNHVNMLCQYFTLLPQWAGELKTKAYDLLDYIYYLARQNTDKIRNQGYFNVSLKSINDYLGSHDPEQTTRHTEYIIDPILNAIEEIEEKQKGEKLLITPIYDHDYKNARDFLEGYLQIQLGEEALNYFCKRSKERETRTKKYLKK